MKFISVKNPMELLKQPQKLVACMGYFDGLHLGHQLLFNETIRLAKEKGLASAIITFDPDPWSVLHDSNNVKHLTPLKEKHYLAQNMGIDYYITIHFTKDVSKLSPKQYIDYYLIPLNVSTLVVGEDFKFGYKGQGNVNYLKEHASIHFDTHVISIDRDNSVKIGTTAITQHLLRGNVEAANKMLGRPYTLSGFVIDGRKQGRKIGFPTANLDIVDEYIIPAEGVYAGYTEVLGKKYRSLVSIGHNPTFNHTEKLSVETYILDFNTMIYGELLKQSFDIKLRDQIKFDSISELIEQMKHDEMRARTLLDEIKS